MHTCCNSNDDSRYDFIPSVLHSKGQLAVHVPGLLYNTSTSSRLLVAYHA